MGEHIYIEENKNATSLEQKITFLFVCIGVMALTYGFFFVIDFLPEKSQTATSTPAVATTKTTSLAVTQAQNENVDELPERIIFDTLDNKQVTISNPTSDTVSALDSALLKGVVRHPDSADFKNTGTIFLLGHSSYLPNVINKNFQAFNGIQKLKWGDTIRLQSKDTEYIYSVDRVYEAKASDAKVAIQKGQAKLTLATCNSFATKDDRFIVEASLVSSHVLPVKS